jgi:hypothetical protein
MPSTSENIDKGSTPPDEQMEQYAMDLLLKGIPALFLAVPIDEAIRRIQKMTGDYARLHELANAGQRRLHDEQSPPPLANDISEIL